MKDDFTQILREFLKENGLSQSEFARRIGAKPGQVSEWLKGKAKPGYDYLKKMSLVFGITSDFFLGIKEEY